MAEPDGDDEDEAAGEEEAGDEEEEEEDEEEEEEDDDDWRSENEPPRLRSALRGLPALRELRRWKGFSSMERDEEVSSSCGDAGLGERVDNYIEKVED